MITSEATISIRRIPIECLQVKDRDPMYASMVQTYVDNLRANPHADVGIMRVVPSSTHTGMWTIDDGRHKFCAYIIAGRKDALCVVIEEPTTEVVQNKLVNTGNLTCGYCGTKATVMCQYCGNSSGWVDSGGAT